MRLRRYDCQRLPLGRFLLLLGLLHCSIDARAAAAQSFETLTEPTAQTGDSFGRRIAISGDTMMVGMPRDSDVFPEAGAVIVYRRVNDTWVRVQKLAPDVLRFSDFFGWSVAIAGDLAVVGAPGDDRIMPTGVYEGASPNHGAAYVFRRQPSGSWALEARLEGLDARDADEFGGRVAVGSSSVLVAGIYHDWPGVIDGGAVWTFERANGVWAQGAKLGGSLASPGGRFGLGLSVQGDVAAIGEPDAATVWIFTRQASASWTSTALTPPTTAGLTAPMLAASLFGYSVALAGSTLVVGAPLIEAPPSGAANAGLIWIFETDGAQWSIGTAVASAHPVATERLGETVAISTAGDVIASGPNGCTWVSPGRCVDASLGTPLETALSPARVFRLAYGQWREIGQLTGGAAPRLGLGAAMTTGGTILVVGAPGGQLLPADTAGALYTFELADLVADIDGDALPDTWEQQFGLNPLSAAGADGASGDFDGDGITNAAEFSGQTHPVNLASATRYLAEGATGFFETRISLANPGSTDAHLLLRFLRNDGTVRSYFVGVPAQQSRKVAVSLLPDMSAAEFSTVIESDQPVVVDRQMWWDTTSAYGTNAESSLLAPSLQWYFAEGATQGGFDLFYLLQNPSDNPADVRVRYLRPSAEPLEKTYVVPPRSRFTIWADMEDFPAGSGVHALAATDVGADVAVLNGVPIIAERAMYLSRPGAFFEAGHQSAGVAAPALHWFLAEGATGSYFDLFVLLANPSSADAEVRATYLLPDGRTFTKVYTVAARSRANIWVDEERFSDGQGGEIQALADTAVSTTIESLNSVPIIVERSMWWPGPTFTTRLEAHNAFGSALTATRWGFAEGIVLGPPTNADTYFLIANTSTSGGHVRVTLLFDDGGAPISKEYEILPQSRFNVPVRSEFPAALQRGFGAIVESIDPTPLPLVVERAIYNDAGGMMWRAGSDALGTPIP